MASGVKLKKERAEEVEQPQEVGSQPGDIYESVVRDLGLDPLAEMDARLT